MGTKTKFCLLLVSVCTAVAQAQPPAFQSTHYNTGNSGLSHNTVLNVSLDQHGFLWISTMDGLNRFDGLNWHVYKNDPDDSTSLSDSFVHGAAQHQNGDFWITTRDGGINHLNVKTGAITRYQHKPGQPSSIPDSPVNLMYEDHSGFMWAGFFTGGIGHFDVEDGTFSPANLQRTDTGEPLRSVNSLLELNDGSMVLSSMYGVFYVPSSDLQEFRNVRSATVVIHVEPVPVQPGLRNPNSDHLHLDKEGVLWAGTVDRGLVPTDPALRPQKIRTSLNSGLSASSTSGMIIEREHYLLSGSANGFISYTDKATGSITPITITGTGSDLGIAKLKEDRQGNLWYYVWGGGLYHLREQKGIHLFTNTKTSQPLPSSFILSFEEEPGGGYWIGTNNGLARMDAQGAIQDLSGYSWLADISIWSMERDRYGLWLATRYNGLLFISNEEIREGTYRANRFDSRNSPLLMDNVHQVMRDSRDRLWIGYQGEGIQVFDDNSAISAPATGRILHLRADAEQEGVQLSSNEIRKITEDASGNIWIAFTDHGFNRIHIDEGKPVSVTRFGTHADDDVRIPHNDGRYVHQQDKTTFWLATYGGGLLRWKEGDTAVRTLNTNDGLPNNSTYGILEGKSPQELWISTNLGLGVLNTQTMSFTQFRESDGLQNNEFNTGAYFRASDGSLLFGGVGGFNRIFPAQLNVIPPPPPVYITSVNLFNEPLQTDTLAPFKNSLTLPYDQNFLSFELAAPDYSNPEEVSFAYRMTGVDEQWVESGNRNFADYPNLAPGTYAFQVKAANSAGIWNEQGRIIHIRITPPWWQTIWFRLLVGVSLLALFGGVIRYFSQRKLRLEIRRMEMENRLRNERERISRDLHDHVGAQLANIISGLTLVDKYNEVHQKDRSEQLMRSLRGDAEITIRQLRETIWALNQKELTLKAFKEQILSWFGTQSAMKESLNIKVEICGNEEHRLSSSQALNLFRIIQEASQNTLKYAGARNLTIQFEQVENELMVYVSDDGTFREKNAELNSGYGLTNMKKRAREIGGSITIDTGNGTRVQVQVPLSE